MVIVKSEEHKAPEKENKSPVTTEFKTIADQLKSFITYFQKRNKVPPALNPIENGNPEEDPSIIVPEDLLQTLHDMGFTDRETNEKVLRFHTKFSEGLDSVIEDILLRQNSEMPKPK
jgi:hypothetical protein